MKFKQLPAAPAELTDAVFKFLHENLPPIVGERGVIGCNARRYFLVVAGRRQQVKGTTAQAITLDMDDVPAAIARVLALFLPDAQAIHNECLTVTALVDEMMQRGEEPNMSPAHTRGGHTGPASPDPSTPSRTPSHQHSFSPDVSAIIRDSVTAAVTAVMQAQSMSQPQPASGLFTDTNSSDVAEELARSRKASAKVESTSGPYAFLDHDEYVTAWPKYSWPKSDIFGVTYCLIL